MASDALRETLVAPRPLPGRWRTMLMRYYRQKLFEAAYALVADGDLNMRLSRVASILIQIDDEDIPVGASETFERVRDPLIARPLVVKGEMVPQDLDETDGRALAQAVLDLLAAEVGEVWDEPRRSVGGAPRRRREPEDRRSPGRWSEAEEAEHSEDCTRPKPTWVDRVVT